MVKVCSPYPRYSLLALLKTLGVDSCVFLIFTTRVRKHLGNSGRFPPLIPTGEREFRPYRTWIQLGSGVPVGSPALPAL